MRPYPRCPSRRAVPARSRRAVRAATATSLALALGSSPVAAATPTAGSWRTVLPGSVVSESSAETAVAVDGDRVLWARLRYESTSPYRAVGAEVLARPLDGGTVARVPLDLPAVTRPTGEYAAFDSASIRTFRVRDGRVYLLGTWMRKYADGDPTKGDVPSGLSFVAVFDLVTGALLRQQQLPAGAPTATGAPVLFLVGNPAVLTTSADTRREYPLLDPWASVPLSFPGTAGARVAGPYALVPSPDSGGSLRTWGFGSGTLRVVEIATGRVAYRLSRRRLSRAAGAPREARPDVTLMTDGSLGVSMPTGGRRAWPVAVDPTGRIVRIGGSVRHTRSVPASLQGARAIVGLEATVKVDGTRRSMRGLWLVDRRGRRGARISTAATDGMHRDSLVPFWADGEQALWSTTSPKGRRVGLIAATNTGQTVLRRGIVPSTAPGPLDR